MVILSGSQSEKARVDPIPWIQHFQLKQKGRNGKSSHGKCHQKILNVIKKNHMENMPQKILIVVKEGRSVSGFPLSWLSYCSSCGGTNALQTTHRHITRMCKCSCALLSAVLCVLCNIVQKSNSASCLFLIENFFIGVIFPVGFISIALAMLF